MSNRQIFSTKEYDNWVSREGLLPEEKEIILKYLSKKSSTLEAGTASGRILIEMNKLQFENLSGFDFVPKYIEAAEKRDKSKKIKFFVQDATKLDFGNESFDQLIYLQQIISTIENPKLRTKALDESFRVLKKGGTALFSFLCFESKINDPIFKVLSPIIFFFRKIKRDRLSPQYLPWLKYSGKINFKSLLDLEPYNYWFKKDEITKLLKLVGFEIIFVGFPNDILTTEEMNVSDSPSTKLAKGHLYVVCKKNNL